MDLVTGELSEGESFDRARRIAASYPRFPFPGGWKANLRGVDLNLQYPAGWEQAREIKSAQGIVSPAPADYVGPCMSDITGRRGIFLSQDMDGNFAVLHAKIPLASLYRYSTILSSLTGGAATFTMKFSEYQQVPADVQKKLLEEYAAQEKEEE
jgi:hypothetical protein